MGSTDRRPLAGTPTTNLISARYNNRLGAVYSALYSFWTSRQLASGGQPAQPAPRRDAYSVILFDEEPTRCVENNFISSSEELLDSVMCYGPHFGTDFGQAIRCAEDVMRQHWNTERYVDPVGVRNWLHHAECHSHSAPVVIFLSDGECSLEDEDMRTLCRAAISLGWVKYLSYIIFACGYWIPFRKPLSFHGVAFGTYNRTLFRMVGIARRIQATVPGNPLVPQTATIESSFAEALDTVCCYLLFFFPGWNGCPLLSGPISGNFSRTGRITEETKRCSPDLTCIIKQLVSSNSHSNYCNEASASATAHLASCLLPD